MEKKNVLKFVETLKALGYVPRVPVSAEDLADPKKRRDWIVEKNMMVFSFILPESPLEIVDVFVKEPLPFDSLYKRRVEINTFGIKIPVVGIDDLIKMKKKS